MREKLHGFRRANGDSCLLQIMAGVAKGESTAVLQKLAKAIAAESFCGIQVNKTLFSIDAHQETSGSGRMRIDAVFNKKGQIETP